MQTEPSSQAGASAKDGQILDPAALMRLKKTLGKRADELLPGLIDTFTKDGPQLLAQLHQALERAHAVDPRRAAHTLESNGANFGAMELAGVVAQLEALAKTEKLEGATELVTRVEEQYRRAESALLALYGRAQR